MPIMLRMMVAAAMVAVALAVVLIWKGPLITPGVYRFGFFLGLATLGAIIFLPRPGPSEGIINLGRGPLAAATAVPFALLPMAPFVLLLEVGIAGYRGFSSFMRYLSLVLAILGAVALLASLLGSLLIPWFVRRQL